MLKPFHIRNLHLSPAEENLYDSSTESVISSSHVDETQCRRSGLIRLTGPEYEDIIRRRPKARLTYIDDDDGDTVTIGSSFELEQRLDEPTQPNLVGGFVSPNRLDDTPLHLFDIRRSKSVIELWKDVENTSARREYGSNFTTELDIVNSHDPMLDGNDGQSPKLRELDDEQSTAKPPQLPPKEKLDGDSENTVVHDSHNISGESGSKMKTKSAVMPLSGIAGEGRRQAEEPVTIHHDSRDIPMGSQAIPDFLRNQQNPWAPQVKPVTESKHCVNPAVPEAVSPSTSNPALESQSTQIEAGPEPLLSAFEAEMAKILEENAREKSNESTRPTSTQDSQTPSADSTTGPTNFINSILETVACGIENLGSELKSKVPEIERHLANAQRNIPDDVGATMQTAISAFEFQIQNLARVIQSASDASGEAAEKIRQAELRSTEQVISGLGDMAHEFEEFGKTLFAAFEAEFGRRNISEAAVNSPMTAPNQETNTTQSQATDRKTSISTDSPNRENEEKSHAKNTSPQESTINSSEMTTGASNQQPIPTFPGSTLPLQTASQSISNNQVQAAGSQISQMPMKPLFSSWPNRPAFVSSYTPSVIQPPAISNAVSQRQIQPSESTATDRQPESRDTCHTNSSVTSLFMGNIGFQVNERILQEVFASKGFAVQVHLPIDSSTGQHAGFGYARFRSASSAKSALDTLQGIIVDGHSLNLEYSDSSPIDDLQTSAVNQTARKHPKASPKPIINHRHSWQPGSQGVREHRFPLPSSSDNLPSVFSGNARRNISHSAGPAKPSQGNSLVEEGTSQNHPEESPEFTARYPSLLPTFQSQAYTTTVPKRSMTLSPNSEMARFPPVSQLDAHLLADQHRSDTNHRQSVASSNRETPLPRVDVERAIGNGSSQQLRGPRRTASTINPERPIDRRRSGSGHDTALRRRATEATSLRHRAHENVLRGARPSSLYDGRTRTLPGSFPLNDAPVPASDNDNSTSSDQDLRTAIRQSLVDNCVDILISFGYGDQVDGGRHRLSIYAEAADGKVSDAIDMIEEERTAYERYKPNA